ncbi:MAG: DUF1634 domain-containing protein [Thermoplasmata archaeon]|nr:DUF1634 domain-containing protein [Thermoplasmata archaeon]
MSEPVILPRDGTFPPTAYERMAWLLRVGLFASLALLVGGLAAYLWWNPRATATQAIDSNPILRYLDVEGLARGLASADPTAYLTVGLLVLVATPIVRVAAGFFYFRRGGERSLAAITFVVLVLLLLGLLVVGPLVR